MKFEKYLIGFSSYYFGTKIGTPVGAFSSVRHNAAALFPFPASLDHLILAPDGEYTSIADEGLT